MADSGIALGLPGILTQKKTPEKPGPQSGRKGYRRDRRGPRNLRAARDQSPKYGRSPLRSVIRAFAINRRSTKAIRRPNRVLAGARRRAVVSDMLSPRLKAGAARLAAFCQQITYTRCQSQLLCLHSSMTMFAVQQNDAGRGIPITKKAAGNPAALRLQPAGANTRQPSS
jgi:hypothetical protein